MLLRAIFAILLFLTSSHSYAWQSGETKYFPLECASLINKNADKLSIKITAESGSYGTPYLIGTKDNREIWSSRFPAEKVNLAKFDYSCDADTITLWSADPGPNKSTAQLFRWQGKYVENIIKFKKGVNTTEIYKSIPENQEDRFVFWAKGEQKIHITLSCFTSPYTLLLFKPESKIEFINLGITKDKIELSYNLRATGEYKIIVKDFVKKTNYRMRIEIN